MLYFIVGKEPNEQEFPWHVGGNIPRLGKVDHIYADGHELEHLQRIGFALDNTNGNVRLYGDRANSALRALRLHANSKTETPQPEIGLGDVVKCGEGAYMTATVCKVNEDGTVDLFRPYTHTADFSYTGGVICYVGIEDIKSANPARLTLIEKGQKLK
jgi:hypothetical protein